MIPKKFLHNTTFFYSNVTEKKARERMLSINVHVPCSHSWLFLNPFVQKIICMIIMAPGKEFTLLPFLGVNIF